MRFASRLDQLPPYVFSELRRKITEKKAAGHDVISLGAGDPDLPTPDSIINAAVLGLRDPINHRYPDNQGKPEFRMAIANFMKNRFNIELDVGSEIYPCLGGKEAIHHLALLTLSPADVALSPDLGYPLYRTGPVLAGADVFAMPLVAEKRFLPDFEAIPKSELARARLMYLNYPNNPTGAIATPEFFAEVVEFARANDIVVVHDNAYSEISFDDYKPPSFLQTPGAIDIGVEVHSLSKSWNMTGWRLGWIAGNSEIISRYARLKPNVDAGIFGAMQFAAIKALTDERDFPGCMSKIYQDRRDLVRDLLTKAGLSVVDQKATPFMWVQVPDGFSSQEFADELFGVADVVVSAGSSFGTSGEGFFRIALMNQNQRLIEATERICKFVVENDKYSLEN